MQLFYVALPVALGIGAWVYRAHMPSHLVTIAPVLRDLYAHVLGRSNAVELEPMHETRLWTRVENTADELERSASFNLRGSSRSNNADIHGSGPTLEPPTHLQIMTAFSDFFVRPRSAYAFCSNRSAFRAAAVIFWTR